MRLEEFDFNLLMALHVLLEEQHVSRAAERVGITQPAMSNALARLRLFLDDEVLVRGGGGMVPTARAESMRQPVANALRQIEMGVLNRPEFDPATATDVFSVVATDHTAYVVIPTLLQLLAEEAPNVNVDVQPLRDTVPMQDLVAGQTDLVLRHLINLPDDLYQQQLFTDRFVCVVRKGHPVIGTRMTMKKYLTAGHVLVSPWGGMTGLVDAKLAEQGLTRRVVVTVPTFMMAPEVVVKTDYVVTMSERLACSFARHHPLRICTPPFELETSVYGQFWHGRTNQSAPHQWFRSKVSQVAKSLT